MIMLRLHVRAKLAELYYLHNFNPQTAVPHIIVRSGYILNLLSIGMIASLLFR